MIFKQNIKLKQKLVNKGSRKLIFVPNHDSFALYLQIQKISFETFVFYINFYLFKILILMKTEQSKEPLNQPNNQKNNKNQISLSNASHPFACIFTFLFKALAFVIYFIIGNFFSDVNTFIIVVVLSALDFWTVKNVTGRLLVGLRWWSDFDQKGKQIWKFDSWDKQFSPNPVDTSFFWMSQIASTAIWAVFLVLNLLTFSIFWSLLCLINLSLSFTNLVGYYKCRGAHNKKVSDLKKKMFAQGVKSFFTGN